MEDLHKTIEGEKIFGDSIFESKLRKIKERGNKFSSFWDEDYYKKITNFVGALFNKYGYVNLLEVGKTLNG